MIPKFENNYAHCSGAQTRFNASQSGQPLLKIQKQREGKSQFTKPMNPQAKELQQQPDLQRMTLVTPTAAKFCNRGGALRISPQQMDRGSNDPRQQNSKRAYTHRTTTHIPCCPWASSCSRREACCRGRSSACGRRTSRSSSARAAPATPRAAPRPRRAPAQAPRTRPWAAPRSAPSPPQEAAGARRSSRRPASTPTSSASSAPRSPPNSSRRRASGLWSRQAAIPWR
jgi:hypothetical protein